MPIDDPNLARLAERFRARSKFEREQGALTALAAVPGLQMLAPLIKETPGDRARKEARDAAMSPELRAKAAELRAKLAMAKDANDNDRFAKMAELQQDQLKYVAQVIDQSIASAGSVAGAKAGAINGIMQQAQDALTSAYKGGTGETPLPNEKVTEARQLGANHRALFPSDGTSQVIPDTFSMADLAGALRSIDEGSRFQYLQEYLANAGFSGSPAAFMDMLKNSPEYASGTQNEMRGLVQELELAVSQGAAKQEEQIRLAQHTTERALKEIGRLGVMSDGRLRQLADTVKGIFNPKSIEDLAAVNEQLMQQAPGGESPEGEPSNLERTLDDLANPEPVDPTSRQLRQQIMGSDVFNQYMEKRGFAPGTENDAFRSMMGEHRDFLRAQRVARRGQDPNGPTTPQARQSLAATQPDASPAAGAQGATLTPRQMLAQRTQKAQQDAVTQQTTGPEADARALEEMTQEPTHTTTGKGPVELDEEEDASLMRAIRAALEGNKKP